MNPTLATTPILRIALAVACVLLGLMPRLNAQFRIGVVEGFDANEYYPEPDNTKLHWRIEGAKAEPREAARYWLTGMKLRVLRPNGEEELAVEAPECLYDAKKRTANSPGRLKVLANNGGLAIEGEGFTWQQTQETNWTLTISNQVHASVPRPTTNAATGRLIITSGQFAFDTLKREAVFRQGVHAEDAEIAMNCETLSALADPSTGTADTLRMERNFSVLSKQENLSASADRADYSRTNETLNLSGNVAWSQGEQRGRADRIALNRLTRQFVAEGQVALQVPSGSIGLSGLLAAQTNGMARSNSPAPIHIAAAHLLVLSNLTVLEGGVRIQDSTNVINCETFTLETTGKEQTARGEGNVSVCRGDATECLRAAQVIYRKSTGAAVFIGKPSWRLAQTEGRADEITLKASGELQAIGNVAASFTVAGKSNSFLNLAQDSSHTNQLSNKFELFSRELYADRSRVILTGEARIHQSPMTGSEPHLRCDTVTLHLGTNASVERMEAVDHVRFEQGLPGVTNGPNAHSSLTAARLVALCAGTNGALSELTASGGMTAQQPGGVAKAERAVYTAATEILELVGEPTLQTPEAFVSGAEKIVWNRRNNKVTAQGLFEGTAQTNALKHFLPPAKTTQP